MSSIDREHWARLHSLTAQSLMGSWEGPSLFRDTSDESVQYEVLTFRSIHMTFSNSAMRTLINLLAKACNSSGCILLSWFVSISLKVASIYSSVKGAWIWYCEKKLYKNLRSSPRSNHSLLSLSNSEKYFWSYSVSAASSESKSFRVWTAFAISPSLKSAGLIILLICQN